MKDRTKVMIYIDKQPVHFCYLDREVYNRAMNRAINIQKLIKLKAKKEFNLDITERKDLKALFQAILNKNYSKSQIREILLLERDTKRVKENWLSEAIGGKNG